jgi:hypothetical protein
MNCIFKLYAGFCCLLNSCKCKKPTPQDDPKIDHFNPFMYTGM